MSVLRRVGAAPAIVWAALLLVYLATLAPSVTFWDAGEFVAAGRTLGIPHPPGTPLYVLALRAATVLLPFRDAAVATNVVSAVVSAGACAVLAALLAPSLGTIAAAAAGLVAGTMSTVWLNATETEVYGASLLLTAVTLWAAERAGRTAERRWLVLVAYLTMLAVPLHLSALLAGPAVVWLAATDEQRRVRWSDGVLAVGVWIAAMGAGRMSAPIVSVGAGLVLAAVAARELPPRGPREPGARVAMRLAGAWAAVLLALAVAASAVLVLLLRARHDPWLNQGNPSTWGMLADVVARRQYSVASLWPRQAPLWLQLGNVAEYVDWQVALSLGPTVIPTAPRIVCTVAFVALGFYGSLRHRAANARQWWALLLLLVCGTVGAAIYLNMKASPSFGWGVLPAGAIREARERDYFFVLGFWVWGAWAGVGAVALARRLRRPAWAGLLIAALPLVLNWRAVTRRREPEASLAWRLAEAMLESAPPRAVLFLEGDNDTYPVWYAQRVRGLRRDVVPVTVPLLPAGWYRDELRRRDSLLVDGGRIWAGLGATTRQVANIAAERGRRPVVASLMVRARTRRELAERWVLRGLVLVAARADDGARGLVVLDSGRVAVDTVETGRWAAHVAAWRAGRAASPSTDPMPAFALELLDCPARVMAHLRRGAPPGQPTTAAAPASSLDSLCNLR